LHPLRGPGESSRTVVVETGVMAALAFVKAFATTGARAGSQQHPPAGSVRQQQPARRIWAMRPAGVPVPALALAGFAPAAKSAAAIVTKTIPGRRGSRRNKTMDTPTKKNDHRPYRPSLRKT
jgi:hypothetical protein